MCLASSPALPPSRPQALGVTGPARVVSHVYGVPLVPALPSWHLCLPLGPLPVWDAGSSGCWWPQSPVAMPWWPTHSWLLCWALGPLGASPGVWVPCLGGSSRGPIFPQAAPRASMANTAARSATVPTGAGATASTGPASVTQGSTVASATWVSPCACWLPCPRGTVGGAALRAGRSRRASLPRSSLGSTDGHLRMRTWGLTRSPAGMWGLSQVCGLRATSSRLHCLGGIWVVFSLLLPPGLAWPAGGLQPQAGAASLGSLRGTGPILASGASRLLGGCTDPGWGAAGW